MRVTVLFVIALSAMMSECSDSTVARFTRSVDTCGEPKVKQGLVVLGRDFKRGNFPWIVALMHTGSSPPAFFCGASLISKTFVISAAHCIQPKHETEKFLPRDVLALFGAHNLTNPYESGRYQLSPRNIFMHDDWNPFTSEYDGDLSLLEFEKESITFNTFVQPVCMWDSKKEPTVTEGVVTGWGKSEDPSINHENIPKLVNALIQANEDCFLDEKNLLDLSSRRTFCAGLRNGSGVCHGDSGGGLFIKIGEVYHLKGIVSSSLLKNGGCDVSKNAVYTNVFKFKDWIERITGAVQVPCILKIVRTSCCGQLPTCALNRTIDTEGFVLESQSSPIVKRFEVSYNRNVRFLLRNIGEKFPRLIEFDARNCSLTIIRDFYFKNMRSLQELNLDGNRIKTIEPGAFNDLVSVLEIDLNDNLLETLDEKLLAKLVNLKEIHLDRNKIKFLAPTTFRIPSDKLAQIHLGTNVCIDKWYYVFNPERLEADLKANCTR